MTPEELKKKIQELERETKKKRSALIKEFCDSRNPFQIGDIFTDHIGNIKITSISYSIGVHPYHQDACCIYEGVALTMDKKPRKTETTRTAWQSNHREKPVNLRHFTVKKDTINKSSNNIPDDTNKID